MDAAQLGSKLRSVRETAQGGRGISQLEVERISDQLAQSGKGIKISRSFLSEAENGRVASISLAMFVTLLQIYQVAPEEFFNVLGITSLSNTRQSGRPVYLNKNLDDEDYAVIARVATDAAEQAVLRNRARQAMEDTYLEQSIEAQANKVRTASRI